MQFNFISLHGILHAGNWRMIISSVTLTPPYISMYCHRHIIRRKTDIWKLNLISSLIHLMLYIHTHTHTHTCIYTHITHSWDINKRILYPLERGTYPSHNCGLWFCGSLGKQAFLPIPAIHTTPPFTFTTEK